MAAAVASAYNGHHHGFSTSASNSAHVNSVAQPVQQEVLDDQYTTLFCRALYDYEAQDASALSFRRNDIIEVLTQQPSGWWDGLLGDERGWFPSNYVAVISDEEAELAFSGSDFSSQNQEGRRESIVDMSHAMMRGSQAENEDWLDSEVAGRDGLAAFANAPPDGATQSSDFWMPQVTSDGQIFYLNTKTGQHSRDLPQEADDEISDNDLAGLQSQSSSRSGTSAGLGLSGSSSSEGLRVAQEPLGAGFGVLKRTDTPDPWVRKLADDGMSYYYWNQNTRQVQWTRPEETRAGPPLVSSISHREIPIQRLRSGSTTSQSQSRQPTRHVAKRLSIYSDDSDVEPNRPRLPQSNDQSKRSSPKQQNSDRKTVVELTSAERIAQLLQKALAPPPPELVTELSSMVQNAIHAVVRELQSGDSARQPEDPILEGLVQNVISTVRNLLYISAAPTGHIPSNVIPKDARDRRATNTSQALLKPAQRKVTATLSKLVLSARAMQYDSGSSSSDTPNRIEGDAEELARAVASFVVEVQRSHTEASNEELHKSIGLKRLRGVFLTANVGLGLVGGGAAGSWKGFGWVSLDDDQEPPGRLLGTEVLAELGTYLSQLEGKFNALSTALKSSSVKSVQTEGQHVTAQTSMFLNFVANIHIARHVDIDGQSEHPTETYAQTVEKARLLVRTLEAAVQVVYDEGAALLVAIQSAWCVEGSIQPPRDSYDHLEALSASLKSNVYVVQQTVEALLSIGHEQADIAQGDYTGSIEWRMSRLSVIDTQFGGSLRPLSTFLDHELPAEDLVDMEHAFRKPGFRIQDSADSSLDLYRKEPSTSQSEHTRVEPSVSDETIIVSEADDVPMDSINGSSRLFDDDPSSARSPPRGAAGADKLRKILGDEAPQHYLNTVNADSKPWYLRPNYDQSEILIDPDGAVRGGTVPALVERLTAHDAGDPTFIKTFLMTYKSFTTLDELFDLLVQRFYIQPPPNLNPAEREEWGKLKQHVIQIRVLNTFKAMVVDDDILEKEDLYILDRMKEFITSEDVTRFAAAKQLMILIERTRGGDTMIKKITGQSNPPPPILPKSSKKLKLLDIDPLELARQLTIMESQLYQKIRPIECLQRSREQKDEHNDNIATVIQTSNRIADWVAESILSKEDSRRRAAALKQFISVADRCRALHNYSTMVAITSGLNTPPIRRLKRTWEQVNQRFMAQLGACEMTLDTTKNFTNYRSTMASVTPPCVPFIGVFLTTLTFIQDGSKDKLPGNLVNFRKRQKASEVIQDIKRWQSQPFNFHAIPSILSYIEESLNQFNDMVDARDHFWNLSLEREPREREDEKMARLLQESGFL